MYKSYHKHSRIIKLKILEIYFIDIFRFSLNFILTYNIFNQKQNYFDKLML